MPRPAALPAALLLILAAAPVAAGVRLVAERDGRRLEAVFAGPGAREVTVRYEDRTFRVPVGDGEAGAVGNGDGWRVEFWHRGPRVAGWASRYHVVRRDGRICAEVLASRWLGRALAPVLTALVRLGEREPELAAIALGGDCGRLPLAVAGRAGFPLAVSDGRRERFVVRELRFGWPVGDAATDVREER